MTAPNRMVLVLLPVAAAVIAFWLLGISPKRQEASDLEAQVVDLQTQLDQQEQLAAGAEAARQDFPRAYRRVVVLGKAAPEDDDTSSLLVHLNRVAQASGVSFVSLTTESAGSAEPAPPPTTPQTPADTAAESEQQVENVDGAAAPAPTEATAALLPIGASIGPAGLPVMKYSLSFEGDFFRLADFLAGLDEMVKTRADGSVGVRGRLITVDQFELLPRDEATATEDETTGAAAAAASARNPELAASFTITTFLTPADEGVTGGASPTGPAPATEPQPASTSAAEEPTATASTSTP